MTPKEKAEQLILKFSECGEDNEMYIETARKCALLCMEELKEASMSGYAYDMEAELPYYEEVITELNAL